MEEKRYQGHLSLEDRQQIHLMWSRGLGFAAIGRIIGRDRSVVKRELERNQAPKQVWRYLTPLERAREANERAKRRRSDCKKGRRGPLKLAAVRQRIETLLEEAHYSPETIADILSRSDLGVKISGKTIRRWILKEVPGLRKHLPHRGKRRCHHLTPKKKRRRTKTVPEKRSIRERPAIVERRERAGDYEGDTIVCKKSKTAIVSVIDRKTRRRWYRKVPNLKAETVLAALLGILLEIPPTQRHTITFDKGSEFAEWKKLEQLLGITVYFCDAYCAWQKGGVERSNKEFRRFVPKGTDLALVSETEIARIENVLNMKPMDCLAKASSFQAWRHEQVEMVH